MPPVIGVQRSGIADRGHDARCALRSCRFRAAAPSPSATSACSAALPAEPALAQSSAGALSQLFPPRCVAFHAPVQTCFTASISSLLEAATADGPVWPSRRILQLRLELPCLQPTSLRPPPRRSSRHHLSPASLRLLWRPSIRLPLVALKHVLGDCLFAYASAAHRQRR